MNLRALIGIIILAGSTYAGYYFWVVRAQQESANAPITPLSTALGKEVPLITIEHTTKDDSAALIVENIDTPHVRILSDTVAADRVNAYFARFIDDTVHHFRDETKRGAITSTSSAPTINTFTLSAKVLLATPRLITIAFTESTMLAQIQHPQKFIRYITFDLMQTKVVEAKDLFEGTEAMTRIASQLSTLDAAKSLTLDAINQALLRDDQHAVSKDGLLVSVDTEEDPLTKTRSSLEFTLPYKTIDKYIKSEIKQAILTEQDNIRMAEPESADADKAPIQG